jgi:WD40 repeat protein/tRNA A-37 threonylcarbamoyl transferase component Bud32
VAPAAASAPATGPGPVQVPGYEILGELGRGGMGVVYKARQIKLNRLVALKMILAGGHAGEAELTRFRAEAEAIARLQHPHIVQVYEVGEHDGRPFFSLEFCPGGSLAKKLAGTPLPPREAARLVETLARAVQAAHQANVVHRDLNPANVLLAGDGTPKVTDFGLAKQMDQAGQTASNAVMGTPSYMAPEQAGGQSKAVGPAADLHALGAILYEVLTGRPPFKAATMMDTLVQVVADDPVPPTRLNAKVPRDLETICLKCLEKDPRKRYATAAALAEDLERFQAGEPILARPAGVAERALKWVRRRPMVAGLLAAVLLVSALGIAAFVWAFGQALVARDDARYQAKTAKDQEILARKAEAKARDQEGIARQQWDRAEMERLRAEAALHAIQIDGALRAWQQHDVAGAERILAGVKQPLQRTWEQRYLRGLCDRKARPLLGHRSQVNSVAISADGKRIVSGGGGERQPGEVMVWDAGTGRLQHSLKGHRLGVTSVAISADGKRIVSGSYDRAVKVWDAETGLAEHTLGGHKNWVRSVAISADGKRIVSGSWDGTVKVWGGAGGVQFTLHMGKGAHVSGVAISAGGNGIVGGSLEGTVKVWDAETGMEKLTLQGHTKDLELGASTVGLLGSPPGRGPLLAASTCYPGRARNKPVSDVALSPDGRRIVSVSLDSALNPMQLWGAFEVWDAQTGKKYLAFRGHASGVHGVAFSADGKRIVSGGNDGTVRVWDAETGQEKLTLRGHTNHVSGVTFSPDRKRIISGSSDRTVRVWDAETDLEQLTLRGHSGPVSSAAISASGKRLVSGSYDKTVKVWDADAGLVKYTLEGHAGPVSSVAFSADGKRIASGSSDKTVKVWDAQTGAEEFTLRGHKGTVSSVMFSADGKHVVSCGYDKTVKVWDAATGLEKRTLKGGNGSFSVVAISADGQRIAAGVGTIGRETVTMWQGNKLGVGVRVWDARTGEEKLTLKTYQPVSGLAFSADGKRIVSASYDRTVKVWDAQTGEEQLSLRGHTDMIASVAISADGARIASGGFGGAVKVWDAKTGQEKLTLKGHLGVINGLAFSADSTRLVSASHDKTVKVWDAPPADEKAKAPARP